MSHVGQVNNKGPVVEVKGKLSSKVPNLRIKLCSCYWYCLASSC